MFAKHWLFSFFAAILALGTSVVLGSDATAKGDSTKTAATSSNAKRPVEPRCRAEKKLFLQIRCKVKKEFGDDVFDFFAVLIAAGGLVATVYFGIKQLRVQRRINEDTTRAADTGRPWLHLSKPTIKWEGSFASGSEPSEFAYRATFICLNKGKRPAKNLCVAIRHAPANSQGEMPDFGEIPTHFVRPFVPPDGDWKCETQLGRAHAKFIFGGEKPVFIAVRLEYDDGESSQAPKVTQEVFKVTGGAGGTHLSAVPRARIQVVKSGAIHT